MEPYGDGGASSSSNPTADLEALLRAMRLGDPSSSHHHAAIPSLLLNQQQQQQVLAPPHMLQYPPRALLPTATPDMRPLPPPHMLQYPAQGLLPTATPGMRPPPQQHMLQYPAQGLLPTATPDMRPPPPQHMLQYSAQGFLPIATPDMRLLPRPHMLQSAPPDMRMNYFGGEGFPGAGHVSTVGAYIPFGMNPPSFNAPAAAPTPSEEPGPSNLRVTAQEYRPISLPTPPALLGAGEGRFPLTRAEVLSRLLQGSGVRDLVLSEESSAHVVHLLAEGDPRVLESVLACVKPIVHNVMTDNAGHAVFLELLRASDGKFDELAGIIDAVCNGKGTLMAAFNEHLGAIALGELIRTMGSNPLLCKRLVLRLVRDERLMKESKGYLVLRLCFTMLPYGELPFIVQHARDTIDEMHSSPFWWKYLAECLAWAKRNDIIYAEDLVLSHISEIAKGKWSSYLLQHILCNGSDQLKARVLDRVAANFLDLSMDKYGSYVVQTCFMGTASPLALRLMLAAVLNLGSSELHALVLGYSSVHVVRSLLVTATNVYPVLARTLAFRIEGMPEELRRRGHVKQVLHLIDKLFPLHEVPPFV